MVGGNEILLGGVLWLGFIGLCRPEPGAYVGYLPGRQPSDLGGTVWRGEVRATGSRRSKATSITVCSVFGASGSGQSGVTLELRGPQKFLFCRFRCWVGLACRLGGAIRSRKYLASASLRISSGWVRRARCDCGLLTWSRRSSAAKRERRNVCCSEVGLMPVF